MTNAKKLISMGAIVLALGASSLTVLAASGYSTPAEALAGLTGKTTAEVTQQKQDSGKTYGALAAEAGVLEQFKAENLEMKKTDINQRVAEGTMTQAQADEFIAALTENQATCDGSGQSKIGQQSGARLGATSGAKNGNESCGQRQGMGQGMGQGMKKGQGSGQGQGNGSCQAQ